MARRKRKEEDVLWTPPEFDEVGYMQKEIENAKIAVVIIGWSAVGAIIAFVLWEYVHPVLGFFAGLGTFGALYFLLPMLGLPIHGFKRRDWTQHGVTYFFSWLAFWILILNPPFGDHTAPVVNFLDVGGFRPTSTAPVPGPDSMPCIAAPNGATVHVPSGNTSLYVLFRATDDVGVTQIQVRVNNANATYTAVGGQPSVCAGSGGAAFAPSTYGLVIPMVGPPFGGSPFVMTVTDWDAGGLSGSASLTISTP